MCGWKRSFALRPNASEFYREVLWHCLVQRRVGVFGFIVARLLMPAPLNVTKYPLLLDMAAQGNRPAWNTKWRDITKKEKQKRDKRYVMRLLFIRWLELMYMDSLTSILHFYVSSV